MTGRQPDRSSLRLHGFDAYANLKSSIVRDFSKICKINYAMPLHGRFSIRLIGLTDMKFKYLLVQLAIWCACLLSFGSLQATAQPVNTLVPTKQGDLRIATYNVSLNRRSEGQLTKDLATQGNSQAKAVAAVIRTARPDIVLLNEVDYASEQSNAQLFVDNYLNDERIDSLGSGPINYPFVYIAPVNTGVPSGMDLNNNGSTNDPEDCWGYGAFPGQYGMAILSKFEIESENAKSLQKFLWSDLPNAKVPQAPGDDPYYDNQTWSELRLSSKSFWDVPIRTPLGTLHVLASHPTPPAFDGKEDRNGCRNHDEIKLIQHYIEAASFLKDDAGEPTGLKPNDAFVVLGDLNSDPKDGGSLATAISDLIHHPRVTKFSAPSSHGALQAAKSQGGANNDHQGAPDTDTSDFNDRNVGNLRIDYALPSRNFDVTQSGVFWPSPEDVSPKLRKAVEECMKASDHHLVWVDVVRRGDSPLSSKANWQPLFNGHDLDGWEHVDKGKFVVENGMLKTQGGMGLLYCTKQKFENAVIRVVYKNVDGANAGVFIRIPEVPKEAWKPVNTGFEIQIYDKPDADSFHKTGVLYSFTKALCSPSKADQWNTMEITLNGDQTQVRINDKLVTDFTEGDKVPAKKIWYEPDRGPRPQSGYIGLQNHGQGEVVYFREVSWRPLY